MQSIESFYQYGYRNNPDSILSGCYVELNWCSLVASYIGCWKVDAQVIDFFQRYFYLGHVNRFKQNF